MKKMWHFFASIILILQSISPSIIYASDLSQKQGDFNFSDVKLTNSGDDISAIIQGTFTKSDNDETVKEINISGNFKLEDTTNQPLMTDSGEQKGTFDISNQTLRLKATSAGTYQVAVKLSGKYQPADATNQVIFKYGDQTLTKELTGVVTPVPSNNETVAVATDVEQTENTSTAKSNVSQLDSGSNFDSSLISKSNATGSTQFTTETHIGLISIDANKENVPNVLENAYIDITIPTENVVGFEVPAAGIIKSTEKIVNDDGTTTIRVHLTKLDSTTTASFPFTVKFKNRETPGGYSIEPKITLFSGDAEKPDSVEASGDLKMATKVVQPSVKKYVFSNSNNAYSIDNIDVYAGTSGEPTGKYITNSVQDITFQYAMNTWQPGSSENNSTSRDRSREYDSIVLTDTLPTYTDVNGNTATAQFDPEKNPGWTLSADGKSVSKTVTATKLDDNNDAAQLVSNEKLVLTFDGAPFGNNSNTIKADVSIHNKADNETNPSVTDDINFNLTSDVRLPNGMFDKRLVNTKNMLLEAGQNHLLRAQFRLFVINKTSVPMSNIVLSDTKFDSELYLRQLIASSDASRVKAVYGIKADGTKEQIDAPFSMIDGKTASEIDKQVDAVTKQGADPDEQTKVTPEYTGLEIQFKDDYKLMPGQQMTYDVVMALNNPYNVGKDILPSKQVYNEGKVNFDLELGNGVKKSYEAGPVKDYAILIPKTEQITIYKRADNNLQGTIGERIRYQLALNLSQLFKTRTIKNATLIDLLPTGVTFDGTGSSNDKYTIVENYLNSGRQAIIFNLGDLNLSQLSNPVITKYVYAKINDKAVSSNKATTEKNNKNYVYLSGDNLDSLVKNNNVATPTTVKDYFDINQNGDKSENVIGTERDISVNLPAEIKSSKWIRGEGQTFWIPTGLDTKYQQNFEYNLSTENYADNLIKQLTIYDRLPYNGDANSSQFANTLRGALKIPKGFTAYYRTDESTGTPEAEVKSDKWVTEVSDYSKVTAIKVVMDSGTEIQSGATVDVIVPMTAPTYVDDSLDAKSAINNFYTSRDGEVSFGKTNDVYNRMPQSLKVTKSWIDGQLDSITVQVYRASNSDFVVRTANLTKDNNYTYKFNDLPGVDEKGEVITDYKVREVIDSTKVSSDDYQTEITGNQKAGFVITNELKKTAIAGEKVWDDANNQDGGRPDNITVNLLADGKKIDEQVVSAKENWKFKFDKLQASVNGKAITYSVTEEKVADYTTTIVDSDKTNIVIKNTHKPSVISVSGAKNWDDKDNQDGIRPNQISVNLLADGKKLASKIVKATDDWQYVFDNLPKFSDGKAIVYTVTEDSIDNYKVAIDGYKITNTYTPGKTSVTVTKGWDDANNQDGIRPANIQVQLYADGIKVSNKIVELDAKNNWTTTFTDLDVKVKGVTINYTVKEVDQFTGYTSTIDDSDKGNIIITNSHAPELTVVKGTKTWDDADNQDGIRPENITVNLLADGVKIDSKTVTAADEWAYSFENLPKFSNGKAINYTLSEEAINGYKMTAKGYDMTNTHQPDVKSISVTKKWSDYNNQFKSRPGKIQVQLYANGVAVGQPVDVTAENEWQYSWENLSVKQAGKVIDYTMKEVSQVSDYKASIDETDKDHVVITNTYTKEVPSQDKPSDISTNSGQNLPKTSDTTNPYYLLVGLFLVILSGFTFFYKKR